MLDKHKLLVLALGILFFSCKSDKAAENTGIAEAPREITHYNIKIVSDLSNRIDPNEYPRQLEDQEIIGTILHSFPDLLGNYNRLALQKDKISYGLLNPLEVQNFNDYKNDLTIDLGEFEFNQNKRIEFIKNRNSPTLEESIASFNKRVGTIYQNAIDRKSYYTADTWGFFKQVVDENYFDLSNPIDSPKARDVSRNVIILLTDGFIEVAARNSYNSCTDKSCKLLNTHQIQKFRDYYNNLEEHIPLEEAFEQSGFAIEPVHNPNLKNVEVLMLEVNGRSKTKTGRIIKTPTDFEILKLFWEDFLSKEGVQKVAVKKVQPSTDQIKLIVEEFLAE